MLKKWRNKMEISTLFILTIRILCIGVGYMFGKAIGYKRGFADGAKLKKK